MQFIDRVGLFAAYPPIGGVSLDPVPRILSFVNDIIFKGPRIKYTHSTMISDSNPSVKSVVWVFFSNDLFVMSPRALIPLHIYIVTAPVTKSGVGTTF